MVLHPRVATVLEIIQLVNHPGPILLKLLIGHVLVSCVPLVSGLVHITLQFDFISMLVELFLQIKHLLTLVLLAQLVLTDVLDQVSIGLLVQELLFGLLLLFFVLQHVHPVVLAHGTLELLHLRLH